MVLIRSPRVSFWKLRTNANNESLPVEPFDPAVELLSTTGSLGAASFPEAESTIVASASGGPSKETFPSLKLSVI